MTRLFYAVSEDGQLKFSNKQSLFNCMVDLDKQKLIVKIEKEKNIRTLSQNRYYFLYLDIISKETGELAQKLHSYFTRVLLPPVFETVLGKEYRRPRSTTELSKAEFSEYLDKISALVEIPLPDPELVKQMYGNMPEIPTDKYEPKF